MKIEVIIAGNLHFLEISDKWTIKLDDRSMSIISVSETHICLLDTQEESYCVQLSDVYRALYGGSEPLLDKIGWFISQYLLSKQHELAVLAQLAATEIKLQSVLPCAWNSPASESCNFSTRKALQAHNPGLPGSFVVVPVCPAHLADMKRELSKHAGVVSSSVYDGDIEYPIGQEG